MRRPRHRSTGRFLLHILPSHFVKIRHFGLMASGNVSTKLESARALLPAPPATSDPACLNQPDDGTSSGGHVVPTLPWPELLLALTGIDVLLCPRCHGRTIVRQRLPPARASPPERKAP
ncbi:MAG: hypothetical protein JXP73_16140 [Deltaproteobacteria bacterium]|nr:hypothetical protein [Deltaproteobacteria bacterium]